RNKFHYFLTLLFFILSCLSKVTAVTFPVVIIFMDGYKNKNLKLSSFWNKAPFFVISIIFGLIAMNTREDAGHLSDLSLDFSLIDRVFLIAYSILFYPFKLLIPSKLSAFYPYPTLGSAHGGDDFLPIIFYLSLPVLLIAGFFVVKSIKKFPL